MSTNRKLIVIVSITLIIGLGVGFCFGKNKVINSVGGHLMPDGTYMSNDGMDMAQMMADMNKALMGKTGDEFDKAFLSEMIVHHQGAVEMAKLALTNAKHQEIKDLAQAIISAQNKEIGEMSNWMNNWYRVSN
jgi:uncharacterized protein (DUF305 family)